MATENDGLHTINILKPEQTHDETALPKLTSTTTALLQTQENNERPLWKKRGFVIAFHLYLVVIGMTTYSLVQFVDCKRDCSWKQIQFIVWTCMAYGPPFLYCFVHWVVPCIRSLCFGYVQLWREGI